MCQSDAVEMLASGSWVTRERVRAFALVSALGGFALLAMLLATSHHTIDSFGRPVGTDFSVFWNAGDLANHGRAAAAWTPDVLNAAARHTHGGAIPPSAWLYPPIFLFVATALALLPYIPALILWQTVSALLAAAVAFAVTRDRRAALVAVASPLTPMVLAHGQNSWLTASLLGFGLLNLERRPWIAGLCLGALIYKPQLGLVIAPMLLLGRQWRPIAAAIVSATLLVLASTLLWGVESWQAFLASLPLGRSFMEQGSVGFFKSASLFAAARQWGAGVSLAYAVQSLGVAAALLTIWRVRKAPAFVRNAGTCAAIALSTPYLLDYDMTVVALGGLFLYAEAERTGFRDYERSALAVVWMAPWFARPAAEYLLIPFGPVATILIAGLALRRVRSGHRHSAVDVESLPGDVTGLAAG